MKTDGLDSLNSDELKALLDKHGIDGKDRRKKSVMIQDLRDAGVSAKADDAPEDAGNKEPENGGAPIPPEFDPEKVDAEPETVAPVSPEPEGEPGRLPEDGGAPIPAEMDTPEPAVEAEPAPIGDVQTITIKIPLANPAGMGYVSRGVSNFNANRLTIGQSRVVTEMHAGLLRSNAQLANGDPVQSKPDCMRWLLENMEAAKA
ncbi:hypothetical protein [Alienimonas sp. DA493]|uniref:hypothetical protein n=1 Tax=Alienimonas sp. DA493 TaxID=3373605 RepID=UPI003754E8A5